MNDSTAQQLSRKQLILSLLAAAVLGVGLSYFIILPAERKLEPSIDQQVTKVSSASSQAIPVDTIALAVSNRPKSLYLGIDPQNTDAIVNEFGEAQPVVDGANIRRHEGTYKSETVEITLGIDESVEYKALMEQGEVLLYDWQSDGDVYFDFHAHQESGDPNFFTRYVAGEGQEDRGSIVALYQGQHGWYWLNIASKPLKISLSVSGYYEDIIEVDLAAED